MSSHPPVYHVRLKPGINLAPGIEGVDKSHFVVEDFTDEYYALFSDMDNNRGGGQVPVRVIRRIDCVMLG